MRIGILGINHKSAALPLREKIAKACERLFGCDRSFHAHFSSVLLSTCNRTEIYFCSEDPAETHTYLLNTLRSEIEEEFEHRIYSYFGSDCFFHLARVTSGVDSALIGETEIQGQVKKAYETTCCYRTLAFELHFLFQKCLKIGKNIRTHTPFMQGALSIEEAVLKAGAEQLGDLRHKRILFVGLSEINHKIFVRFKQRGFRNITLCNRSQEKAQMAALIEEMKFLPWEELSKWTSFDLAIFGTKCPNFLITKEDLKKNISRKVVIDLSVPRNVDPRVGRHRFITLLNVDQLKFDTKQKLKAAEIARDETQFIARAVEKQVAIFKLKELQRPYFLTQAS
jgi:glutamyl-tRNA reductase